MPEQYRKDGVEHIALARQRQVKNHKKSVEKDVETYAQNNGSSDLVYAGIAYAFGTPDPDFAENFWPFDNAPGTIGELKIEKGGVSFSVIHRIKELAKAGALLAAEIDRLQFEEAARLEVLENNDDDLPF